MTAATKPARIVLGARHDRGILGGWYRPVTVDGIAYRVGVERGKRVRIAYKPRGPGGWGYWWHGFVRDEKGKELWSGRVGKSQGVRGLLYFAGLLPAPDFAREIVKQYRLLDGRHTIEVDASGGIVRRPHYVTGAPVDIVTIDGPEVARHVAALLAAHAAARGPVVDATDKPGGEVAP